MTNHGRVRGGQRGAARGVAAWIAVLAFAGSAAGVYRLSQKPRALPISTRPWTARFAPKAEILTDGAVAKLKNALEALDEGSRRPEDQLQTYRRDLEDAQSLLEGSLLASPLQPATLAKLAAVRWELDPQDPGSGEGELLGMIATASSLAAHVPETQVELGSLLLRMGRLTDALPYFARAVTLHARVGAAAVATMSEGGLPPEQISQALRNIPEVLIALRRPYSAAGQNDRYLDLLERSMNAAPDSVLRVYVDACIEAQQAARALETLQALGPTEDAALVGPRLLHTSRAARAAGRGDVAVELATRARTAVPGSATVLQELGLAYLADDRPGDAAVTLRDAVAAAAAIDAPSAFRAALYRDLGRAEEADGHPDRAYDEYRRSLQLDPEASYPRQRLDAMRRSAGTREP